MSYQFPSEFWRLCDEVTVVQAALLILNIDPEGVQDKVFYTVTFDEASKPDKFDTVLAALQNAIIGEKIIPTLHVLKKVWINTDTPEGDWGKMEVETQDIDFQRTLLSISALKAWLAQRGMKPPFFFPDAEPIASYLDPTNSFYAPKLAAAVHAWIAVTGNDALQKKKTPKKAIEKWLHDNAEKYELIKEDGTLNVQGIEDISKVANWKPEGGASRT